MQPFRAVVSKLATVVGLSSMVGVVGCGTSGNAVFRSSKNFSNASLNGAYAYELRGSSNLGVYREAGVFTADGAGNIGKNTAGSDDSSFSAAASPVSGNYSISQDGTGFITMTSSLGTINLAVTLVSSSKLYLMEADGNLNAFGVAELQDSSAIGATPSGTYVFRLHQERNIQSVAPAAQVGIVSLSSGSGSGAMDQNLGGTITSPNITMTLNAPAALGRGTGSLTNTSASSTSSLVYYIVNSGKLNLLITDQGAVGSGSAEAQSGAVSNGLSGSYAFGSQGDDANYAQGFYGTVATAGQMTVTTGAITGVEDLMQDGTLSASASVSGCSSALANGRVLVTNGSGSPCSGSATQVFWMVNPARAFFLDLGSNFDDGTADLQTTSSFAQSTFNGQFGMVMGGIDATPELVSRVGVLQFDGSSKLTLNEEVNASVSGFGATSPGVLTGTYSASPNGRVTGKVANGGGPPLDVVIYGVSGSKAYILQTDGGVITSGTVELQQ